MVSFIIENTILFSLGFVPTAVLALFISIIIDRYLINKRFVNCFHALQTNIVAVFVVWVVMLSVQVR